MEEKTLAKGIIFFEKHQKAPDFVLGNIVLTIEDIRIMFNENQSAVTEYKGKHQLKLQLLKSKEGKPYAIVDTYKQAEKAIDKPAGLNLNKEDDDLPF